MKAICRQCSVYTLKPADNTYKCAVPGACPGLRCQVCDVKGSHKYLRTYAFMCTGVQSTQVDILCNVCVKWCVKHTNDIIFE